MRKTKTWTILLLSILISILFFACESETKAVEEDTLDYTVTLGSTSYTLSPDLTVLTGSDSSTYQVDSLEVTVNGVSYVLSPVYDESGAVTGYTATAAVNDETVEEEDIELILLNISEDTVFTGPLGDIVVSGEVYELSGYTVSASGSSLIAEADGISYTLTLNTSDCTYISIRVYEGLLGDLLLTESMDARGTLSSSYSLEGYDLAEGDGSFQAVKDGVTYTLILSDTSYSYTISYKASSDAYKLGTITATDGKTVLVKGEYYDLEDNSFDYTVTSGTAVSTYRVTLDDVSATYSTEMATVTVYSGDFGDLTVTSVSGKSIAVFDGEDDVYEVEDGTFTLIIEDGSVTTTYTIALGSDSYTATALEVVTVYTASSDDGDIGDIYVTETFGSKATSFVSESGYILEETGADGVLTVTTESGNITFTLTLSEDSLSYDLETDQVIETLGDEGLGAMTVVTEGDTVTVVLDGVEYVLEDGSFSYTEKDDNKTVTYTVTVEDDSYSYSSVTVETYYGSLGVITVTTIDDESTAVIPGESDEYDVEDGSISYSTEGSDTLTDYTIALSSDYTYTLTVERTVTTYTGTFGTVTATTESGVTTAVFDGDDTSYTVEDNSFEYGTEDGNVTTVYTITLKTSTYNAVKTEEQTVYESDFGDITIREVFGSTTATIDTEVTIDSTVYTVTATDDSGGFTLTVTNNESSATYTLTLSEDGTYTSDATTVTYVAADGAVDLGSIVVIGDTATIGGSSRTLSGSTLDYTTEETGTDTSVTTDYTITLSESSSSNLKSDSDYTYTYTTHTDQVVTVTTATYTGYQLGSIVTTTTVTDIYDSSDNKTSSTGVIAKVGSADEQDITSSPTVFSYDKYTITLSGSTYSYVYDYSYTGALSTLVETRTVQSTGATTYSYAMSGYTFSDTSDYTSAVRNSITYTLIKNSDGTTYNYQVTYTVASGSVDLGGITYTVDKSGNATCDTYDDISWIEKSPVVYSVTLNSSSYTYTTTVEQITYSAASGAVSFGSVVVKGTSAVINSTTKTVSSNSFYYTDGSVEYLITLNTSAYTYSTTEYKITYTEQGSTIGKDIVVTVSTSKATIGGSGSYTVTSSNTISETYTVSPYTYSITLDSGTYTYTTSVYSTVYTYSSGVGTLGDIVVYSSDSSAIVKSTTLSPVSASTYRYSASLSSGGISIYTITLTISNSTPVYTTAAYEKTYVASGTSIGTIKVVGTTVTVGSYSTTATLSSSSATSFTYTISKGTSYGSETYSVSLNTSAYTYTASSSYITYVAYGSNQNIGSIKIASGTSITLADNTTLTKSSSATSFSCTYNGVSYYDVTLSSTYYTYTANKRIVVTYTDSKSYYGNITATVTNGSLTSYSISAGSYSEKLAYLSGTTVRIEVGYVQFSGSLSKAPTAFTTSGSGTYSATNLYYISSSLLKGYGTYEIDAYFFYVHSSSYYNKYSDYCRDFFLGINGTAGSAKIGLVYNALSIKANTACGAYFEPDGLTVNSSVGVKVVFSASDSTIATMYLKGTLYSAYTYYSKSSCSLIYYKGAGTKTHVMDSDVIYISTASKSGYTLTNSVGSKNKQVSTFTGDLYYKYSYTQLSSDEKNFSSYISGSVEFDSAVYTELTDAGEW